MFNVLQTFTGTVPADVIMDPTITASAGVARAYGLKSSHGIYVYLRDAQGYTNKRSGVTVNVNPQKAGTASFYDTTTGAVLKDAPIAAGPSALAVPDFVAECAGHSVRRVLSVFAGRSRSADLAPTQRKIRRGRRNNPVSS